MFFYLKLFLTLYHNNNNNNLHLYSSFHETQGRFNKTEKGLNSKSLSEQMPLQFEGVDRWYPAELQGGVTRAQGADAQKGLSPRACFFCVAESKMVLVRRPRVLLGVVEVCRILWG